MKLSTVFSQLKFNWIIVVIQLSILTSILLTTASANMVISDAIVHFEPGKPLRKDVEVKNPSSETLYIEITPSIVHNPGSENESRETISDPRKSGLLVTPNKIVVPPGGRKLVRIVSLNSPDEEEHVYRVTFKPIVGEIETEQIGVKILIGYEVLVLLQPNKPDANLVAKRSGKKLSFSNEGNTNVLLRQGTQCPKDAPKNADDCETLRGKRIYPGNQWSVDLPYDKPVEYQMSVGTKNSVKTFN